MFYSSYKYLLIYFFLFESTCYGVESQTNRLYYDKVQTIRCSNSSFLTDDNITPSEIWDMDNSQFRSIEDRFGFGYTSKTLWIRINCTNLTSKKMDIISEFSYTTLTKIHVFTERSDKPAFFIGLNQNGEDQHKRILSPRPNFYWDIGSNETKTIHVRLTSIASLQSSIIHMPYLEYKDFSLNLFIAHGIVLGILLSFVLFSIFMVILIHFSGLEYKFYISYLLFTIFNFLYQITHMGYSNVYFWDSLWLWKSRAINSISILVLITVITTAKYALNLKNNFVYCEKIANYIIVGLGSLFIYSVLGNYRNACVVTSIVLLTCLTILLILSAIAIRRNINLAKVFFLGWICLSIGITMMILRNLGVLPYNFITSHSILIGTVFECLFFAVGCVLRFIKYNTRAREQSAVIKTTQMIAHDIKRPFTMLKALLSILSNQEGVQLNKTINRFGSEIERNINSVSGMLSDLMTVDREVMLNLTVINCELIIKNSLIDTFKHSNCEIDLKYTFNHENKIKVDAIKIQRVFSNLLENASQANLGKGIIWFKTDVVQNMLLFSVGNNLSVIEKEEIRKLFDMFYTKGKKDGTGMGLYIVKKMIETHGGKIWCNSNKMNGTVFQFTLPISDERSDFYEDLPYSSLQISKKDDFGLDSNVLK